MGYPEPVGFEPTAFSLQKMLGQLYFLWPSQLSYGSECLLSLLLNLCSGSTGNIQRYGNRLLAGPSGLFFTLNVLANSLATLGFDQWHLYSLVEDLHRLGLWLVNAL